MRIIIFVIQVKTYVLYGQPDSSQFINQFFVQAQNKHVDKYEGSDKYNCIAKILKISAFNPPLLLVAVLILAYYHIYPRVLSFVEWLSYGDASNNFAYSASKNTGWVYKLYKLLRECKKAFIPAMIIFSIGLSVLLITIYIFSVAEFFKYGQELFCSDDCVADTEKHDYCLSHQSIPLISAISSALSLLLIYIIPLYIVVLSYCEPREKLVKRLTTTLLVINIMFIATYFAPYMFLAFITYPLQTSIIYFILTIFLICSFLFLLIVFAMWYAVVKIKVGLGLIVGVVITTYFFFILNLMATLGNISDFEDTQKLLFPLVIAIISYFVFKPAYKQMREIKEQKNLDERTVVIIVKCNK